MVRDPRERYDDLITFEEEEYVPSEEFESLKQTDATQSGWAVGALVFDPADRILLIDNNWSDGWIVPSGGVKPGEVLSEAVVREVKEEGGIDAVPVRPHALTDQVTVNRDSGETFEITFVLYEAKAESTSIPNDLGVTTAEVSDARWFDTFPQNVYNRELTKRVFRRCVETNDDAA